MAKKRSQKRPKASRSSRRTSAASTQTPAGYSTDLGDLICAGLEAGESLRTVCAGLGISHWTALRWVRDHEPFAHQYARARELQADALFEQMQEIADTPQMGLITKRKAIEAQDADGKTASVTEEEVETVEQDMLGHRKLRIDTLKWRLARMASKKYGDKLETTHKGDKDAPLTVTISQKEAKL